MVAKILATEVELVGRSASMPAMKIKKVSETVTYWDRSNC
jgi:hypothetical protein